MSYESEQELRKRSVETREAQVEQRESKEGEVDPELQRASAMERVDYLNKEIKSSKKQMQNILLHMQQVTTAIRQLRTQLQLAEDSDDPASVKQDKEKIDQLKKRIGEYQTEVIKMKDDLVREHMTELKKGVGVGMNADEIKKKAETEVDKMIEDATS